MTILEIKDFIATKGNGFINEDKTLKTMKDITSSIKNIANLMKDA